jgi:hypothetical protein
MAEGPGRRKENAGWQPKRLRNSSFLSHLIQQGLILLLYVPGCVLLRMSQDVRSPMHPGIASLNIGP